MVATTAAYAASPHEGGGYGASPPTARTSQDIESLTTVYFIIALTAMAILFVVLGVDALTGHNFVNGISGGEGGGLSIAREAYPVLLSAIAQGIKWNETFLACKWIEIVTHDFTTNFFSFFLVKEM